MLESSVDRFGRSVGRAGPVEVGEHVAGTLLEGPPEGSQFGQRGRDAVADRLNHRAEQVTATGAVGFAVGGDLPLVDAPGGLDLDVLVDREQGGELVVLLVG